VNNSGRSQRGLVLDTPGMEVDQAMVNINIFGPISLTKAVLPHMIRQKAGQIIVTSSVAGKVGELPILLPESSFPLTRGWKTRVPGATISGVCHKCRLRSERMGRIWLFPLLFQNGCSQSLSFSDHWSRGTKNQGNKICEFHHSKNLHNKGRPRDLIQDHQKKYSPGLI